MTRLHAMVLQKAYYNYFKNIKVRSIDFLYTNIYFLNLLA